VTITVFQFSLVTKSRSRNWQEAAEVRHGEDNGSCCHAAPYFLRHHPSVLHSHRSHPQLHNQSTSPLLTSGLYLLFGLFIAPHNRLIPLLSWIFCLQGCSKHCESINCDSKSLYAFQLFKRPAGLFRSLCIYLVTAVINWRHAPPSTP
jgi:hypothetical protein